TTRHARTAPPLPGGRGAPGTWPGPTRLQLQVLQVRPELGRQLRPLQRQLDRRLEPAHRRPAVVGRALELVAVDRLLLHQRLDGVRELDLAAGALLGLLELVEDLRREDVAADDRQVRRRILRLRLLDEPVAPVEAAGVQGPLGLPA